MFYVQDAELFIGYKIMNKTPFPTWAAYNVVEDSLPNLYVGMESQWKYP